MSNNTRTIIEKLPCNICSKNVSKNHQVIECTNCKVWIHLKYNNLNIKDYKYHQNNSDESF